MIKCDWCGEDIKHTEEYVSIEVIDRMDIVDIKSAHSICLNKLGFRRNQLEENGELGLITRKQSISNNAKLN